jgi:hypothetical protein
MRSCAPSRPRGTRHAGVGLHAIRGSGRDVMTHATLLLTRIPMTAFFVAAGAASIGGAEATVPELALLGLDRSRCMLYSEGIRHA